MAWQEIWRPINIGELFVFRKCWRTQFLYFCHISIIFLAQAARIGIFYPSLNISRNAVLYALFMKITVFLEANK